MAPRFNTQSFLSDMRRELNDRHDDLDKKVSKGFEDARLREEALTKSMADHTLANTEQFGAFDTRLSRVENVGRVLKWLGATAIAALIVALAEHLF